jgi:hypothetical protein
MGHLVGGKDVNIQPEGSKSSRAVTKQRLVKIQQTENFCREL